RDPRDAGRTWRRRGEKEREQERGSHGEPPEPKETKRTPPPVPRGAAGDPFRTPPSFLRDSLSRTSRGRPARGAGTPTSRSAGTSTRARRLEDRRSFRRG